VWFVAALLIFSTISGKQFHYLLPELPALALLLARLLAAEADAPPRPGDAIPPALLAALAGAAVVALPWATALKAEAPWLDHLAAGWGLALIAAGAALVAAGRLNLAVRLSMLAATAAVAVVAAHLALKPVLAAFYDLRPVAGRLAEWEGQGIALANFGKYHGQYHFLGRLKKPIAVVGVAASDERDFLAAHPTGRIVAYHDTLPERGGAKPVEVFRFRSRVIAVWDAATVIANPGITHR
jgi:4-amino-4-deoxy-L-arabinose transferase-like glycosyltransferase